MADQDAQTKGRAFHEKLRLRWLALWPITVALIAYPVANRPLRAGTVCCVLLLLAGLLGFFWRIKWLRIATIATIAAVGICFSFPGRNVDITSLRQAYVRSLKHYEGTRYVWGGENILGIDCSGLVRAGLINADVSEAFRTRNAALLRTATSLWWHDCSARALSDGYQNLTVPLFDAKSINNLDESRIQPGDLAITEDGIHALAFLGENSWIEAEPTARRVLIVRLPTTNDWFDVPVKLTRWRQLEPPGDH